MIQWTEELSVGIDALDADHKVLINLLNELQHAIESGKASATVERVLNALVDYTDYHFRREEALMRACRYPDVETHVATHAMLKAQVVNIRDRYMRDRDSIHSREVLAFLKTWLTSHIVGRDRLYAPFMASRPDAVRDALNASKDTVGERRPT